MATYKTPFSKRCEILGQLWLFYRDNYNGDLAWEKYFEVYDIGLPLAYMVWAEVATVKRGNEAYVNEAWDDFCLVIGIDPEGKYAGLPEAFAASPNKPIESEDEEEE